MLLAPADWRLAAVVVRDDVLCFGEENPALHEGAREVTGDREKREKVVEGQEEKHERVQGQRVKLPDALSLLRCLRPTRKTISLVR